MKTIVLFIGIVFVGITALKAQSNEIGVQVRKDINALIFGGREHSQQFANYHSTCIVIIQNNIDEKSIEFIIEVGDSSVRTFNVSENDLYLTMKDEYDANEGIISLLTEKSKTSSLKIERIITGIKKSFLITIGNGVEFPVSCEIYY